MPKLRRGLARGNRDAYRRSISYKPRIEVPFGYYHVVTRGNNKRRIYEDDWDRTIFLMMFNGVAHKYGWTILAYVLMGNHYHFVIRLGACENGLSRGMCELNTGYAFEYNRRHGRINHLFGKRYWSRMLKTDAEILSACRYVVLNPVRAGLVDDPSLWVWSSHLATIGLARAISCFDADALLRLFGQTTREAAIAEYTKFCDPVRFGPVRRQPP